MALVVVFVVAFIAYRVTTEAERAKFVAYLRLLMQRRALAAADWFDAHAAFFDALRARKRFAPVTQVLVIVNTITFMAVLVTGIVGGRDALVEWGASAGVRTTNGEWWRLVTSLFVHAGPLHLLACLIGIVPLGLMLERLVGSVALAVVYITSGVFAGLMTLFVHPMAVSAGASGAICGVYGLALAILIWGLSQQPRVTVPWGVLKWLAVAGLIFLGYSIPSGIIGVEAELTGFLVGFSCGFALGRGVGTQPIPMRRSAAIAATAFALALAVSVPVRGITDVRPDIDRMRETDERTAARFRTAATQLVLGRITEKAMIQLIEREIIPALESEQPRLVSHGVVPDGQKAPLAVASEYLQLRLESWHLRATAYRKGSLAILRQADNKEGAARDLLARIPYPLAPT